MYEHGKTPYPGTLTENIVNFVLRGGRMDRPSECPESIYNMMLQCWQIDPKDRPRFNSIVQVIENISDIGDATAESRL